MPHPIRADASIRGASGIAKAGNTNGSERRTIGHVACANRVASACLAVEMRAKSRAMGFGARLLLVGLTLST